MITEPGSRIAALPDDMNPFPGRIQAEVFDLYR